MELKDVKNLKWIEVTDWSSLTATSINDRGKAYVCENDVDNFVDNLFREIARKLDISTYELFPILKEENESFYQSKKRLFEKYNYGYGNDGLKSLQLLLRVPDTDSIPMVPKLESTVINVEKVLEDFSKLSEIEQLEVLKELKLLSIKIEFLK